MVMAMETNNDVLIEQQQQGLPNWLLEANAQTIPDAELAMIQGEGFIYAAIAITWLVAIAYAHYEFIRYARTGQPMTPEFKALFNEIGNYDLK